MKCYCEILLKDHRITLVDLTIEIPFRIFIGDEINICSVVDFSGSCFDNDKHRDFFIENFVLDKDFVVTKTNIYVGNNILDEDGVTMMISAESFEVKEVLDWARKEKIIRQILYDIPLD